MVKTKQLRKFSRLHHSVFFLNITIFLPVKHGHLLGLIHHNSWVKTLKHHFCWSIHLFVDEFALVAGEIAVSSGVETPR